MLNNFRIFHSLAPTPISSYSMTLSDINTEEACQISVAQGMKHMRPDSKPEILNVEDTFPQAAREVCQYILMYGNLKLGS